MYRILSTEQQKVLETRRQIDFSHSIPGLARFRVNTYFQRAAVGAAFRLIPDNIKSLEQLGIPTRLYELADKPRGLVLVTGPTGSGKSTTLASLLDHINHSRHEHILTIEDPIEFLHHHGTCIVNQREIGQDATTFAEGLRAALRQDPDVILVGEMRDLETVATALTAAETGHLVFATLHTQSAPTTIDRVIDVFPAEQQGQVRVQLASTLQGVVTQNLVPTADGLGRTAALEVLMPDDAVRNLIRQAKVEQIYSVMQTSTSRGMQTMEQSLADLVLRHVITPDVAFARSSRPDQLQGLLERSGMTNFTATGGRQRQHRRQQQPRRRAAFGSPRRCRANVDLNKEIKLSDLVRRPKKTKVARRHEAEQRETQAAPEAGDRRPQDRRLADRRLAGRQQRRPAAKLVQLARVPLEPGIVVGGEVRDVAALAAALDSFFTENKLPRRGIRLGIGTNRIGVRTRRHRRHRRRAPARQRRPLPGARGAVDPARPGRARLPRRQRDGGRVRRRLPARPARGRLPGADRPLRRGVPGGEARALGNRRRGLRAAARRGPAAPTASTARRRSPRSSSRSVTTARRWRSRTARSATSCASSTGAARSSRPRSRGSSG